MADRPGRSLPPAPDFLLRALRRLAGRVPESPSLVARLARLGYSARGAVYLLVGTLALAAALGSAERPRGARAARGVVFGLVGWLLVRAAVTSAPLAAVGMAGALRVLQARSQGPWVLGCVGLGLAAYGAYQLACARCRRIRTA
ncbi:MAG: DUF1206 domain-containing protein [Gemmatimonadota bacterium]